MNIEKFNQDQFVMIYGEPFMWVDPVAPLMRSKTIKSAIANGGRFAVNMNTKKLTVITRARMEEAVNAYAKKERSFGLYRVANSLAVEVKVITPKTDTELVEAVLHPQYHDHYVQGIFGANTRPSPVAIDFMNSTPRLMAMKLRGLFDYATSLK